MENKVLDKKHIIIIGVAIASIIVSYFNVTFAYFGTSKNEEISLKSAASFGEATVYNYNDILDGNLTYTTNKSEMLKGTTTSFKKDNVDELDYLLTVAAQVKPHDTLYELSEYENISYEIYHKTDLSLNTAGFTCINNVSTNGDYCNTGTFTNGSLEGTPFELIKDFRISDTEMHYFDVYIYLNKDGVSKAFKTNIFYLDKENEKLKVEYNYYTDSKLNGGDPDLKNSGLVPVRYLEDEEGNWNWEIVNPEEKWYDYEMQEWANAVSLDLSTDAKKQKLLNSDGSYKVGAKLTVPDGISTESDILAMFVWIPRFSYTIGCTSDISCYGYRINGAAIARDSSPGAIDIKFVNNDTKEIYTGDSPTYIYTKNSTSYPTEDRTPSNWFTHPAFWWDKNNNGQRDTGEELPGIWVGKFETGIFPKGGCYNYIKQENNSAKTSCTYDKSDVIPIILPNVLSLVNQNVYNQFETAKKFASNNIYGLKVDAHMMKNSEWAAVAYLSQSIYGKYGNSNYEGTNKEIYKNDSATTNLYARYTGRSQGVAPATSSYSEWGTYKYNDIKTKDDGTDGEKVAYSGTGASTTGNIYGIYDMSGGAYENVMGYYTGASTEFGGYTAGGIEYNDAGFKNDTKPENKYFNGYNSYEIFNNSSEVIGHATAETRRWYSDDYSDVPANHPWVSRGGRFYDSEYAGIFSTGSCIGSTYSFYSFRTVLVNPN